MLDGSASVREFDSYRLRHNFADTLARQQEHYRRKIQMGEVNRTADYGGIASAHDRVHFKSAIVASDLALDTHLKTLFRDTLFPSHVGYEESEPRYALAGGGAQHLIFSAQTYGGSLYKEIRVDRNTLSVNYSFDKTMPGYLQVELSVAMPSCDGPAGRYLYRGECPGGFGQQLSLEDMRELSLQDDVLGGRIELRASEPVALTARPFYTVSQSEAGFEKIMQAVLLLLHFRFPQTANTFDVRLEIVAA
jgi:4-alpha-glucanotransferase